MMRTLALVSLLALAACGGGGGSVGGDIVAVKRDAIRGPGACGVANAYSVTEVSGVSLSQAATINLKTANALNSWVRRTAIPAIGNRGGGLSKLIVVAHYSCRTRNSRPGAKLSEHAKGNAIDIAGFVLKDGSRISVLTGWGSRDGRILRRMHSGACGTFGTVLGPDSDRFHRDHFHFDIANHRGGAYCR